MESRRSKRAEDNDQLEDDELRRNAHPWIAKRTQTHGAYATARTCDRHSPPGVFLTTTLVVCAFRSYRRQGISKLRCGLTTVTNEHRHHGRREKPLSTPPATCRKN